MRPTGTLPRLRREPGSALSVRLSIPTSIIDGTPFTNEADYQTQTFQQETKGRDKRLQQTIRTPGYTRVNGGTRVAAPPAFTYTYTGYQPIKWSVDDVTIDGGNNSTNAVSIFRYAEVLLNYAEAKAELGTITNDDWAKTIGALRSRAGITGGLTTLPTTVDPYLKVGVLSQHLQPGYSGNTPRAGH